MSSAQEIFQETFLVLMKDTLLSDLYTHINCCWDPMTDNEGTRTLWTPIPKCQAAIWPIISVDTTAIIVHLVCLDMLDVRALHHSLVASWEYF